jgi:hypothetical protein
VISRLAFRDMLIRDKALEDESKSNHTIYSNEEGRAQLRFHLQEDVHKVTRNKGLASVPEVPFQGVRHSKFDYWNPV